jgi:hypothetical protein
MIKTKKEICICAAIVTSEGVVVRGHRHGDAIVAAKRMGLEIDNDLQAQGFITSRGRYVNREIGRILQDRAGIPSFDKEGYRGKTLFSEDLY